MLIEKLMKSKECPLEACIRHCNEMHLRSYFWLCLTSWLYLTSSQLLQNVNTWIKLSRQIFHGVFFCLIRQIVNFLMHNDLPALSPPPFLTNKTAYTHTIVNLVAFEFPPHSNIGMNTCSFPNHITCPGCCDSSLLQCSLFKELRLA